jgi:hypothetical protein
VNHFSQFHVKNKVLKIMNFSKNGGKAARLIMIIAPNPRLSGTIEIVGPRADLFIMTQQTNQTLHSSSCVFVRVNKLTLTTAKQKHFLKTKNLLTTLKSNGSIHIQGDLLAEGTSEINLLTPRFF